MLERGVAAGEIDVIDHRDVGTLFGVTDPDGNSWVVQQIRDRAATRWSPVKATDERMAFAN